MGVSKKIAIAALLSTALVSGIAVAQTFGGGWGPQGPASTMAQLDADGDGMINAAELDAGRPDMFAGADTNSDGEVTSDEFEAAVLAEMERRRLERIGRMFVCLDGDGDGILSQEEADAPAAARFARLDGDGDGLISAEEMDASYRHFGRGDRHGHGGWDRGDGDGFRGDGPRGDGPRGEGNRAMGDGPMGDGPMARGGGFHRGGMGSAGGCFGPPAE